MTGGPPDTVTATGSGTPAFDDELLTAYLDGEASAAERHEVERRVETDPAARSLLAELAEVRNRVRSLPAVEPPASFLAELLDPDLLDRLERSADPDRASGVVAPIETTHPSAPVASLADARARRQAGRPRRRVAAAAAAGTVVVAGTLATLAPPAAAAVPVHDYMVRHEAMVGDAGPTGTPATSADPPPADPMPMPSVAMAEADAMGGLPAMGELGGMARDHVFSAGGTLHVMYTEGDHELSVYRQHGRASWASLPSGGEMVAIGDAPAWRWHDQGATVVVLERGADTYTLVSADGAEPVMAAVVDLPSAGPTMGQRLTDMMTAVGDQFRW